MQNRPIRPSRVPAFPAIPAPLHPRCGQQGEHRLPGQWPGSHEGCGVDSTESSRGGSCSGGVACTAPAARLLALPTGTMRRTPPRLRPISELLIRSRIPRRTVGPEHLPRRDRRPVPALCPNEQPNPEPGMVVGRGSRADANHRSGFVQDAAFGGAPRCQHATIRLRRLHLRGTPSPQCPEGLEPGATRGRVEPAQGHGRTGRAVALPR